MNCVFGAEQTVERQRASCPQRLVSVPGGRTLSMTFKSKIDGSVQPFLAKVPDGYSPEKKWPLLVTLHGLGDGPILAPDIESMVQIGPYGRGSVWYTGIGTQDVFECMETAKKVFSIDETKVYLCGFSMGGAGTFNLGLSYPDLWAACVPVCGRCDDVDLVENGRHLAFWVNTGSEDRVLPPIYSRRAFDRARKLGFLQWDYSEHQGMAHSFSIDWKGVEAWLLTKKAIANPKCVSLTVNDLSANRAYWIEITGLKKYGSIARIAVAIQGQKIEVTTANVSGYVLRLDNNLVDLNKEVEIQENGSTAFKGHLDGDGSFAKPQKRLGALLKRPGLCGPLWNIYSSSCVLVYGTNCDNDSLVEAAKRCAESFADPGWMPKISFRIVPDTGVTQQDIENNNLVLFGNVHTNSILAKISERLPVRMERNTIVGGGKEYSGENIGYLLIYPNPLNSRKYAAVFAGNTAETIDCFNNIWPRLNSGPKSIDVGIFEFNTKAGSVKWHFTKVFDTYWGW